MICVTLVEEEQNTSFADLKTMSTQTIQHPANKPLIDIVGINASGNGRSCEEHKCCGRHVIAIDVVLRLRSVQVCIDGVEKPAIAANWVTDGIDRCRVGFLKAKYAENEGSSEEYDGRLVQVVSIYDKNSESSEDRAAARRFYGCCQAAFIEVERQEGGGGCGKIQRNKITTNKKKATEIPASKDKQNKKRSYDEFHDNDGDTE